MNHKALTKAALAKLKAEGVKLGNRTNLDAAARKGRAVNTLAANTFASNVLPIVRQMQASGARTFAEIATGLNNRGIPTARGKSWHAMTVRNLMVREGI